MKKQKRRKEKGITLVALVVTIIVLIILAGVTLNIVLDQNGIINKAQQAAEDYDTAQREEQELLGVVEDYIEYAGKTAPIPEGYTKSQITTEDDVVEGLVIYEIPEGAIVNWTDNEDENGKNQSTITIGENTTNLQETVNQYVWIPVNDINSMVMCESNSGDSVCNLVLEGEILKCTTHPDTATELAGRRYSVVHQGTTTDDDGNEVRTCEYDFTERDQTYNIDSSREPVALSHTTHGDARPAGVAAIKEILGNDTASTYAEIEEEWTNLLKEDFKKMATSVAKNGGFYISRYEVGNNGESKKGQPVLTAASSDGTNYLGANMWYGLFAECRDENKKTQMIWGSQYDQVIKFIGEEAQIGHADRNLTSSPALSGQNNLDKMKNIYDLEGNFQEWTQLGNINETEFPEYNITIYMYDRGRRGYTFYRDGGAFDGFYPAASVFWASNRPYR